LKVLLAHPGTQHSFRLAEELHRRDLLFEFWTCFGLSKKTIRASLLQFAPASVRDRLANRLIDLPASKLRTLPSLEKKARQEQSRGVEAEAVMRERNQHFQEMISQSSIESADIVIGFDTSSWLLIDRAHRVGKRFILDQTTAHPKTGREAWTRATQDFPEWRDVAPESLDSVLQNQQLEHEHADLIVAASSFARDTLIANGVPENKVRVNPYGVDLERFRPAQQSRNSSRQLRFLSVGGINPRKGIPVLLSAWKKLHANDAELWLVGDVSENVRPLIPDLPGLKILGRKSRGELPDLLRSCDVFVFPSSFEGFGLVLLEAMASGLPIIATEATAVPDLIGESGAGKLIQSGDVDQLIDAMKYFIEHRNELPKLGTLARARAEQFSWANYGDRWKKIILGQERRGKG
jgi:glycosyltransferase involved in cell wall biosynthesis